MGTSIIHAGLCSMIEKAHHDRKYEEHLIPRMEIPISNKNRQPNAARTLDDAVKAASRLLLNENHDCR